MKSPFVRYTTLFSTNITQLVSQPAKQIHSQSEMAGSWKVHFDIAYKI